jgi:hypothetical protein
VPRPNKANSLTQKLNQQWRSSHERLRSAFVLVRRLQHPIRFSSARRVARAIRPDPAVAVDPGAGFRLFPPGTFAEADELAHAAGQLLVDVAAEAAVVKRVGKGRKKFLINLLDSKTLDGDHPAVRLALRPDILDATVAYMGTVPVLRSIQVFYSGTLEAEPTSSQLYHCDADDTRQIKIFVLCTDIGHANGPLTLLDADRSAVVRRATRYRFNSRLTDAEVDEVLGSPAQPAEVVGAPGTVCLIDTSRCFHFGSRVEPGAAPRLVAMIQYLSPDAFVLPGDYCSGAAVAWPGNDSLTPLQRAVLTGNHELLSSHGR